MGPVSIGAISQEHIKHDHLFVRQIGATTSSTFSSRSQPELKPDRYFRVGHSHTSPNHISSFYHHHRFKHSCIHGDNDGHHGGKDRKSTRLNSSPIAALESDTATPAQTPSQASTTTTTTMATLKIRQRDNMELTEDREEK